MLKKDSVEQGCVCRKEGVLRDIFIEAQKKGVLTAMDATVNVVQRAIELGANLILVHEPTNYTSSDEPGWQEVFRNDVYAEKARLMAEHGIAVWRDHDHMHAHQPDGIFTGVLKYLG